MDSIIPISNNIYWIGTNDHDTHLFESIWPLPFGVSYNAYIILDEKTALIDTVKQTTSQDFHEKIKTILKDRPLDYLIINHMEPDHSGSIKTIVELFPNLQIIVNKKTAEFLKDFYQITEHLIMIEDGSELNLGTHKLKFFLTPMVHWPETMMTYEVTDKILFSGDAFGGFGTLNGSIFDDEVDIDFFEDEILRYFSNIVGKFSSMVQKAIAKLKNLEIRVVASTHGPVWRKNPAAIIDRYDRWSRHEAENGVLIVYASMYGNTKKMMERVAQGLVSSGFKKIRIHNISKVHVSYIIRDIWRYKAIILGTPTYNTKLFPLMDYLIEILSNSMIKNRILGLIGTYGWSGGGVQALSEFARNVQWDLVEPIVEAKCSPTEENLNNCYLLGQNILKRLMPGS